MRTSPSPAALRKAKNLFSDHTTLPVPLSAWGHLDQEPPDVVRGDGAESTPAGRSR